MTLGPASHVLARLGLGSLIAIFFPSVFFPSVAWGQDPRSYRGPGAVPGADEPAASPKAQPPDVSVRETPRRDAPLRASAEAPTPRPVSRTWVVGAFAHPGYVLDFNLPENHVYRGNVPTPRANEFTLHLGGAYLRHAATDREPWRLEISLQFGAGADALYATEPTPGGSASRFAGAEVWKHIAELNAGARIRQSKTHIAGGLFTSPIGFGVFWPQTNWTASQSWELNGVPYYIAGVRIEQELPAGFAVQAWVANGWQTIADINRVPSYMAGLTYARDRLSVLSFLWFGAEDVDPSPRAWRVYSDTQVVWEPGRWGFVALYDVGRERLTALPEEPVALFMTGAVTVRRRVVERKRVSVDLVGRPEVYWDRDGRIHGIPQTLVGATATVRVILWKYLILRPEYRYDHSFSEDGYFYRGDAVTDDATGLAHDRHTIFFDVVGMFEYAFATQRR